MRLCGGTLVVDDPDELLETYVERHAIAYDRLVTNGSSELVDGDLLAPVLLGVHLDYARFTALCHMLPDLRAGLAALPDVALADASDDVIGQVAQLFAVIDRLGRRQVGVQGSIIAKVLHRKRPALVPLYDTKVWAAYTAPGAIPRTAERSWVEFMTLLCQEMRADLRTEAAEFARLAGAAAAHRFALALTPLRILDILVWMSSEPMV